MKIAVSGKGGVGKTTLAAFLIKALADDATQVLVLDMEAGLEHLGRGTAAAVDRLIIVVEPGLRSLETARRIQGLAKDLGLKNQALVANKVRSAQDREFILAHMPEVSFLDFLPFSEQVLAADREGAAPFEKDPEMLQRVRNMLPLLRNE